MTTIGYATLQIIPSLTGVSDSVTKQLGGLPGMGKRAGQQLGSGIAAGVRASEADIKSAFDNHKKLADRAADATGKLRTAEAQLQQLRKTGANDARIIAGEERASKARRDEIRMVNDAKVAYGELEKVRAAQSGGGASFLSRFLTEDNARSVGTKVGRTLGLTMAAAAGAGIAGIGYTLTKGFERLESIDTATFKLKALGHSGDETKQIMDNALVSVKGTAFGLADAATAAASAVAAGIKPGQDLTKYLTEVGDAAAVAGTSFGDMGAIFNSIQTLNKAYTGDLRQLSDRGLPIFQWLQNEYGVTADKLNDMVQHGEVDSAHFKDAIDKNIGGAAKNMGQSFDGAVQNLEASVARLGANFITALLGGDQGGDALAGPTQAIGNLTNKFDDIGKWVQAHSAEIHGFFEDVKTVAIEVGGAVRDIGTWLVQNRAPAEDLAAVFLAWKVKGVIEDVIGSLRLLGPAATTAGTEAAAGLAPLSAVLGTIMAAFAFIEAGKFLYDQGTKNDAQFPGQTTPTDPQGKLGLQDRNNTGTIVNGVPSVAGDPIFQPEHKLNIPGGGGPGASRDRRGLVPYDPTKGLLPHAVGGQISGPGTGISDSILARVSNGEFIVNADATRKSLPLLEIINSGKLPGFAGGGLVAGDEQLRKIIMERFGISDIGGYRPADKYGEHSTGRALDVMVGANKSKGDAVKDFALSNASAIDLKWVIWRQHLYYPGGGGYDMPDRGSPTQNHMDHVHIFSGTGITNGLRGALAGGPGVGIAAGVGVPAGGPGAEDTSSSDQTAAPSSSGGGVSLASSFSGLSSFGLDGLGSGVGTTSSGSDLSLFGSAAGSAVSGQISSALGVFGVGDSPGWLKAASKLVGGIKVSDKNGNSLFDGSNLFGGGHSAAPISATPTSIGTPPPDNAGNVHGTRAGQQPGPQVVYNIRTATTEDAFLAARRKENERVAAKLSVF